MRPEMHRRMIALLKSAAEAGSDALLFVSDGCTDSIVGHRTSNRSMIMFIALAAGQLNCGCGEPGCALNATHDAIVEALGLAGVKAPLAIEKGALDDEYTAGRA